MGRVVIQFEVMNYYDLQQFRRGLIPTDRVRRVVLQGVVDTGATRLVLPSAVAQQLGLPVSGQCTVKYADQRREIRDVAADAYVQIGGRGSNFTAVLEPNRTDALIGAIVLEELDLLVDCPTRAVHPRETALPLAEIE